MSPAHKGLVFFIAMAIAWGAWQSWTPAQPPTGSASLKPAAKGVRFTFEVIESFDAKYPGDTPGHMGKHGGLESVRPHVSLGDPVFRGETKVGTITGITWDRVRGSLAVEFDPEPMQRIAVGDSVWLALDGEPPSETK